MTAIKFSCFKCSNVIEVAERVGRRDECGQCKSDLHCCMNCEFYEKSAYNECREPSADFVKEKDRANFCDYFSPDTKPAGKTGPSKNDLLSAAEALFKKK